MIREQIEQILAKIVPEGTPIEISIPEKDIFGHYATNVAMRMAKGLATDDSRQATKKNPMQVAEEFKVATEKLAPKGFFEKVEVAPPGFINFWLTKETIQKEFEEISGRDDYGSLALLKGKKIIVEYTDPNPFKQFHIGHLMTNMIGEAIARLYEAVGAEVIRVTWQGDIGMHVAMAVWGMGNEFSISPPKADPTQEDNLSAGGGPREAGQFTNDKTQLSEKVEFLGACYAKGSAAYKSGDEIIKKEIEAINKKIYERTDSEVNRLYDMGRAWSLDYFETMYARLGSKFVRYFFESEEGPKGMALVKAHSEVFTESQGAVIFKGEDYGLHTRVFINAHGLPTYEAKELGLNQEKFKLYNPDLSIIVTGNEINDYFKVLLKAMELTMPEVAEKTKHIGHGMLRLPSGKMSSRTGKVVVAEALISEVRRAVEEKIKEHAELGDAEKEEITEGVALSAIRYSILKQGIGRDIVFDMETSVAFHGDSGPYLQYTYARLRSILRKAEQEGRIEYKVYSMKDGDGGRGDSVTPSYSIPHTSYLRSDPELALIRQMAEFPHAVGVAVETLAPNALALYLYELANFANRFYEAEPILTDENEERKNARLSLAEVTARVLARGMDILGIKALERI
jgi:arginyl-tRNA synthetase